MPFKYPYTSNSFLNLDYFIDQLAQVKQAVEPLRVSLTPTMTPNQFIGSSKLKDIYDAYVAGRPVIYEFPIANDQTSSMNTFVVGYDSTQDMYSVSGSGITCLFSGGGISNAVEILVATAWESGDSYGTYYVGSVTLI